MKKGGINLSINMIIVLIIAIIILGLALSFITSMFGKAEQNIWDQFPSAEVPVDSQNPIGVPQTFRIDPGKERSMRMNVYNLLNTDITTQGPSTPEANDGNPKIKGCSSNSEIIITRVEPGKTIPSGETAKVSVVFKAGSNLQDNDICTIQFTSGAAGETLEQTFFLKVT